MAPHGPAPEKAGVVGKTLGSSAAPMAFQSAAETRCSIRGEPPSGMASASFRGPLRLFFIASSVTRLLGNCTGVPITIALHGTKSIGDEVTSFAAGPTPGFWG